MFRIQMTARQLRHARLMGKLRRLRQEERDLHCQLRNSWLTMTVLERAAFSRLPCPKVR